MGTGTGMGGGMGGQQARIAIYPVAVQFYSV